MAFLSKWSWWLFRINGFLRDTELSIQQFWFKSFYPFFSKFRSTSLGIDLAIKPPERLQKSINGSLFSNWQNPEEQSSIVSSKWCHGVQTSAVKLQIENWGFCKVWNHLKMELWREPKTLRLRWFHKTPNELQWLYESGHFTGRSTGTSEHLKFTKRSLNANLDEATSLLAERTNGKVGSVSSWLIRNVYQRTTRIIRFKAVLWGVLMYSNRMRIADEFAASKRPHGYTQSDRLGSITSANFKPTTVGSSRTAIFVLFRPIHLEKRSCGHSPNVVLYLENKIRIRRFR